MSRQAIDAAQPSGRERSIGGSGGSPSCGWRVTCDKKSHWGGLHKTLWEKVRDAKRRLKTSEGPQKEHVRRPGEELSVSYT